MDIINRLKLWKEKAKARRLENKALKKRIEEITESRDNWKNKAQDLKERNIELEKEIDSLKKGFIDSMKASGYHYCLSIIQLALLIKLKTSTSFRGVSQTLVIVISCLQLKWSGMPSHSSVIIWTKKIGHYRLCQPKERRNDWIILLDESIQIGKEKLLVIFGIPEDKLPKGRSLSFQDLVPLLIVSKESWNGEKIKEEIKKLKDSIGKIVYAVGDHGSSIKKGLRLAKILHIHDITHKVSLILEKIYKEDPEYLELSQEMSKARTKYLQTKFAHLIPNRQRTKSRFLSIFLLSHWGMKVLSYLEREKDSEIKEKFAWVKKYEGFIRELSAIWEVIRKIWKLCKTQGLTKKTINECKIFLKKLSGNRAKQVVCGLKQYFEEILKMLKARKNLLCCSDIVESSFGKYKNYVSNNPMAGITDLALCLSSFTCVLDKEVIKEALENTSVNDLKEWAKNNIGDTLLKKRRLAFDSGNKNGGKQILQI